MVDYRRMGNMEEQHLGNAASSISFLHQLRVLWKSPRGTVLRIEALALVAIALSFFVATFGSCRRWSNRWIVQKGFLAVNLLSISLGTYSIGLMQSSIVKSQMYPIWAVSLFTLLPCVDPVTSYVGPDYKSPLTKVVFQICLYFGYALLMSISTTSTDIGNQAICILCAITLMKGFHRSLALVLPRRLRDRIEILENGVEQFYLSTEWSEIRAPLTVDINPDMHAIDDHATRDTLKTVYNEVDMDDIRSWDPKKDGLLVCKRRENNDDDCSKEDKKGNDELSFHDVSMALSFSHLLQRCFIGLGRIDDIGLIDKDYSTIDYMWLLKVVEVELAFLYEIFFTSNAFIHYYQAKAASLWTFASFIGICFVGVTFAITGKMTGRSANSPIPGAGTSIVVDTTTADLIITLVIIVSLALLQLVLLIRCWTSNWARVAIACQYARNQKKGNNQPIRWWMRRPIWWMRLKASGVTMNVNWFDKYLWQDKLGQYSIVEGTIKGDWKLFSIKLPIGFIRVYRICAPFLRMFGFQYIGQVLLELLGSKTKEGASIRLHADVKASIAEFLGQMKDDTGGKQWVSWYFADGIISRSTLYHPSTSPSSVNLTEHLLAWHIATCYCELAEREQEDSTGACTGKAACFKKAAGCVSKQEATLAGGADAEKDCRVAIALSKYYAYLVKSAPELLPGRSAETKLTYRKLASEAKEIDWRAIATTRWEEMEMEMSQKKSYLLMSGYRLGKQLRGEILPDVPVPSRRYSENHWKLLARFWVQALLYVAPYGNVEAHREHLSQGGEFITHLWALLYHLGIYKWNQPSYNEFILMQREFYKRNQPRESLPCEGETPPSSSS